MKTLAQSRHTQFAGVLPQSENPSLESLLSSRRIVQNPDSRFKLAHGGSELFA
jgi:hypothetical protein